MQYDSVGPMQTIFGEGERGAYASPKNFSLYKLEIMEEIFRSFFTR